jgi:hypothetical protein
MGLVLVSVHLTGTGPSLAKWVNAPLVPERIWNWNCRGSSPTPTANCRRSVVSLTALGFLAWIVHAAQGPLTCSPFGPVMLIVTPLC